MRPELNPRGPAGQGRPCSSGSGAWRSASAVLALLAGLGGAVAPSSAATEPGVSAWVRSGHAAARLLALGPGPGGTERVGAVQIRLDPGYLTYWRQPGEGGLPPVFDTAASQGIDVVAVEFPAPVLLDEGGAQVFGYRTEVTFPLRITAAGDGPALLALTLDYAVCAAICLPGKAVLQLPLPSTTDPEAASVVEAAMAAVPRPVALGAGGATAITDARLAGTALRVTARASTPATLFAEGPEGWFFAAAIGQPEPGGSQTFVVPLLERPADATGPVPLRLTLTGGPDAIETTIRVDGRPPTP